MKPQMSPIQREKQWNSSILRTSGYRGIHWVYLRYGRSQNRRSREDQAEYEQGETKVSDDANAIDSDSQIIAAATLL